MAKSERRGGNDLERLYFKDAQFTMPDGACVTVRKTDIPGANMENVGARHLARYGLAAFFCRPGHNVLDFPCGSGYAAEFLKPFGIKYLGLDSDKITIEYANRVYSSSDMEFKVNDLCHPKLPKSRFHVIGCIEGLEHIEKKYQSPLIGGLEKALRPGGVLIVSSPENPSGKSGRSSHNPFHLWELTKSDFLKILRQHFQPQNIELITHRAVLTTGAQTNCLYGICHK